MSNPKPAMVRRSGEETAERYRMLIEQSDDLAIYLLSPSGHIETWNKAAEKLKQYKAQEVIGKHLSIFYTKEDQERKLVEKELEEAAQTGKFEGSGWRVRKDGSRYWADVIISALRDDDGKLIGFAKVSRDASERKRQEEIIEQQKQDLIELSTPVMQLWEGILVLPIIGTLDSQRSQVVMERLLEAIVSTGSEVAILDVSGVPTVDTMVAQHLMKTMEAAKLMGAECIISGIRPEIAQTMVHLGIDLSTVKTRSTLARGLEEALRTRQLAIVKSSRGEGAK